jgi:hypothetical protein
MFANTLTHVVDHVLNSDLHKIQPARGLQEPNCCVRGGVSVMLCAFVIAMKIGAGSELNKITFTLAE